LAKVELKGGMIMGFGDDGSIQIFIGGEGDGREMSAIDCVYLAEVVKSHLLRD
jgi:hypothetical protein